MVVVIAAIVTIVTIAVVFARLPVRRSSNPTYVTLTTIQGFGHSLPSRGPFALCLDSFGSVDLAAKQ